MWCGEACGEASPQHESLDVLDCEVAAAQRVAHLVRVRVSARVRVGLGEVAAAQRVAHLGRVDAAARVAVRLTEGLSHGRRPMESARRCIRRIGNLEAIPLGSGAMARLWLAEHMHASCLHSVAKPPAFRGHPVGGDPVVALP